MDIIKMIETEIQEFEKYKKIEDSPLGGNVVKAAHYGGHAAGLRSALNRFRQIDLRKLSNNKTRTKCAILDETCVDCEEDCPLAGA